MKPLCRALFLVPVFLSASCAVPVDKAVSTLSSINVPLVGGKEEVDQSEATVDFFRNIKPILERRCLPCHNSENAARGLNLETLETANSSWRGGPVLVSEHPDRSMLYQVTLMPMEGERSPHEIPYEEAQLLYTWIDEGAYWPADARLEPAAPAVQP